MDHARRRPAGPTPATCEHAAAPDRFAPILDLQRTAGNAALTQLLSAAGPQRQATDTLTERTLEPDTEPGEASDEEASAAVDPATKPILRHGSRGGSWRIEPR